MTRRGGSCLALLLLVISNEVFGGRPAGRRGGGVGGEGKEVRWKTAMVEVVRSSKEKNQEDGLVVGAIFNGKGSLAACSVLVDGEVVDVVGEKVKDRKGSGVEWATAWDEGCGLRLLKWPKQSVKVTMMLAKGGLLQQDKLREINVIIHMEDQLLTRFTDGEANNLPTHYDITIVPDLLSTSSNTKFKGNTKVEMLVGSGSTGKKLALHMDSLQLETVKAWGRRRDYTNIVTDTDIVYHSK